VYILHPGGGISAVCKDTRIVYPELGYITVPLARKIHRGKAGYFASIDKARFREIVRPGDEMIIHTKLKREKKQFVVVEGKVKVGDKVVCEAEEVKFALVERTS